MLIYMQYRWTPLFPSLVLFTYAVYCHVTVTCLTHDTTHVHLTSTQTSTGPHANYKLKVTEFMVLATVAVYKTIKEVT